MALTSEVNRRDPDRNEASRHYARDTDPLIARAIRTRIAVPDRTRTLANRNARYTQRERALNRALSRVPPALDRDVRVRILQSLLRDRR